MDHMEILAGASTPEQRALWEKQLKQIQEQNGTAYTPAPVKAELTDTVYEVHAGRDGPVTAHRQATAYASPGLRPGHVMIGGVETTVEAARAAGYDVGPQEGEQRRPFGGERGNTSPVSLVESLEAIKRADSSRGEVAQPQQQGRSDSQESAGDDGATAEGQSPAEAAKAASEAIQAIERTYGGQVVDAGLQEAVDQGYAPEADNLPQGVTVEQVGKIVAGYVAQANDMLSSAGASVDMLMETLRDSELREARMATIMGDRAKLEHLGRQAADRLARLPEKDPEGFAEMVEGMSAKERGALSQNSRGDWVVTVPGRAPMSFAMAVREGIVRV